MEILERTAGQKKSDWSHVAICGPIENAPPVLGCGSKIKLSLEDLFSKTFIKNQTQFKSFHWMCPVCNAVNLIPYTSVPTLDIPDKDIYLRKLREEVIVEFAKLHDDRREAVLNLGDEMLLDDDLINKVLNSKGLWS